MSSMTKYESQVRHLTLSQEEAYARFADLNHLNGLRERLGEPAVQEQMTACLPADKLEVAKRQIEGMRITNDSVSFPTAMGEVTLRIIEREEPKTLKFDAVGAPLPINMWIQLLPAQQDGGALMRVTLGAEVSLFMRPVVKGPLQKAVESIADMLCLTIY